MAYISLYRKYRPHNFKSVVGQEVAKKILINSIKENKISHAYIFSGPRGTGKTSVAKIFAKAVNCLNFKDDLCEECSVCTKKDIEEMDIIEIDAASNNGVDEIREIRNNVKLLPTDLKYKVYIIDEVHMLSTSAFNALLKTLEEPPSHVIFILATTEFNKIPATVISRCQKFDFKKIKNNEIIDRLKYILSEENKELNEAAISIIAKLSDGGLRDAINLLDQVLSLENPNVTEEEIYSLVGVIKEDIIIDFLKLITNNDIKSAIEFIDNYYEQGKNYINLCEKLTVLIKDLLIYNSTDHYFSEEYEDKLNNFSKIDLKTIEEMSKMLFDLNNDLRKTNNQKIVMEIYTLRLCLLFNNKTVEPAVNKENKVIKKEQEETLIEESHEEENNQEDDLKQIKINNSFYNANKELKIEFLSKYGDLNEYISSKKYNSIASLMVKATPEVIGETNILFRFKNTFEVVLFDKNIDDIQKMLKEIYLKKYSIVAITDEEWDKMKAEYIKNIKNGIKYEYIEEKVVTKKKEKNTELQSSIENIFGDDYTNIE